MQHFSRARRSTRQQLTRTVLAYAVGHVCAATALWLPVAAQAADAPAAQARKAYDIPAGPLEGVLNRFGRESGILLSFASDLTAGLNSPGLRGSFTVPEALPALLQGAKLTAVSQGQGAYALVRSSAPAAAAPVAATLAAVTVKAVAGHDDAAVYGAKRSSVGSKTDTPILEIPQSVSVVTARQIEATQPRNLADALAYSAGVVRTEGSDRTADSFVIRGFQAGANMGNLYRDGSKFMVNPYNGQQELYGLERIEVLKGAASLLYGTAAPGGIINTVSKQPTAEPLRELGVELGNYRRKQVKGDFGGPLNTDGSLSYRLTGLARSSDTFVDHVPDDRQFLSGAIKWQIGAATALTLQAEHLHSRTNYVYGLPTAGSILPNPNGKFPSNLYLGTPGRDKYDGKNALLGYLFEHAFSANLTLRHNARAFRSEVAFPSTSVDGLDANQASSASHGVQDRDDFSKAYTTDTSLVYTVGGGRVEHTLLAGVDTTYQYHRSIRADREVKQPFDYFKPNYVYEIGQAVPNLWNPVSVLRNVGVYVQDQMKIDRRWSLLLGARHDRASERQIPVDGVSPNSKESSSATTGRAGLVYLADNGLAPFVSFSQSFQPVSGVAFGGARFKPSRGEQYEAGLRWQPAGTDTLLSAAVYQLTQQNVMAADPKHQGFGVQTGEIRSRGLELEANTRIGKAFTVLASYAYTNASTTADTDPALVGQRRGAVPLHAASVWGEADLANFGVAGMKLGGGLRYVGSTLGLFVDGKVPAYTVADAMLSYETGPWRYALNLNNLGDKRYIASCTYACFFGERRQVVASATYRW
ncbi:TonB-dependent siderophore receptor [Janthinobacterium fluminis]|uniref:TonB-dependent siderophore receptor n=1 Tax=Janthinobacterium fluminis TaxID=2987524 RepID=A0ABT5JWJ9_9BURK|nr:TonB-dependent siderophore receptor [Janthinobacterium fluminis]MDC8756795.1 TonB-dependent siderophore receptor [Janthinobacterium fluminis]